MTEKYMNVWQELAGVTAFFSYKEGACQGSPYRNETVFAKVGLAGAAVIWPQQVHGDHIEIVDEDTLKGRTVMNDDAGLRDIGSSADGEAASGTAADGNGGRMSGIILNDTDGMVTELENVLLTTVHADCTPVFLYDDNRRVTGLVHAGWRGTNMGIAAKAVRTMREHYGCKGCDIRAFIGPAISSCCFEVGAEVYEAFRQEWDYIDAFALSADERDVSGGDGGDGGSDDGKFYIDLKGLNRRQLMDEGLDDVNIEVSPHCTCCQPELFCSYRREGGTYLRMGAGICML